MKLIPYSLFEKRTCLTPGSIYSFKIKDDGIKTSVKVPKDHKLDISAKDAKHIEDRLHDAEEGAIAPYYKKK